MLAEYQELKKAKANAEADTSFRRQTFSGSGGMTEHDFRRAEEQEEDLDPDADFPDEGDPFKDAQDGKCATTSAIAEFDDLPLS